MNPVGNEAAESKRDCCQGIGRSSVQAEMESPANRLSRLMTPTVGTTVGICLPSVGPTPVQRRRKVVQGKYSFSSCGDNEFRWLPDAKNYRKITTGTRRHRHKRTSACSRSRHGGPAIPPLRPGPPFLASRCGWRTAKAALDGHDGCLAHRPFRLSPEFGSRCQPFPKPAAVPTLIR
jgi:hypothetical protein